MRALLLIALVTGALWYFDVGDSTPSERTPVLERMHERRNDRQADRAKRRLFIPFSKWVKDKLG